MKILPSHSKKRKMFSGKSHDSREEPLEKIIYTYGVNIISPDDVELELGEKATQCTMNMEDSVAAVEAILMYNFKDKSLLKEALTHSSYTDSPSYQRLEFVGDAALGLAITNFVYLNYPDLDPGDLSLLRAANISTEKLARVAVHRGLYKYVRHKADVLNDKVREFVIAVEGEDELVVHGGQIKAPKVLADIVESVVAAVYVDCGFNLQTMWIIISELLEPMVTFDVIEKQPQPITMLFETCQKDGKHVDIRHWRKGERNIASVLVDGRLIASGSSDHKENAKLHAAKAALSKLKRSKSTNVASPENFGDFSGAIEIEGAKQRIFDLCNKKRWAKPTYRVEQELGPAHDKRYISCVQIEVADSILSVTGEEKSRVKEAENSAASIMFCALRESGYI